MGNVNESKEKEGFSDEILPESLGCESIFEFDDSESLSSQALEQVASDSDLPIRLFVPSRPSTSEITINESMAESVTPFEDLENTLQHCIVYAEAAEHDDELSKDDSFPLSDSVLPSSFDLQVETSPIPSDSSDLFHTPDNSMDSVEGKSPTGIQNSPGATIDLLFPSPDGNSIHHIPEDVFFQSSPPGDVYLALEETEECQRNDDAPFPTQIQVSIEDKVVLQDVESPGSELCHNTEVCQDLQDAQSESTQIIIDGCQLDEGLSLALFPHQVSATGTHDPKEMTKAEVNNSVEDLLSKPTQMFVAEYQSVEDLFSRLSLDQSHVTGMDNSKEVIDGNNDYSNPRASVDIGGSPPELIQMAPVPIADSQFNEDQIPEPILDEESTEESIYLNEIQGYTVDVPEIFSGLSPDSDSLEWEYPADRNFELGTTSYAQHEIDQHSVSDIQFSLPNLVGSDLPLESSDSEIQIPVLYSVAPSTTEPSSFKTKVNTSHFLDTSEGVVDKDGDEDQDQMDIRQSEYPITTSHLLNISFEPFIAPSERSQLSDHFTTSFSSDLTTPLKSRGPSPLYPLPLEDESDNFVTRNTASSLSLDFEGMLDAAFLDIINPDILVDMESLDAHSTPLESTNEPIDVLKVTSMSAENSDVPTIVVSDKARPPSNISDVAEKETAEDTTIPPNSSHKIERPAAYFPHPQHSSERPHWALAPVDPPKPQMIPAKKPVKIEGKRTLSRRGKRMADMVSTGKTTKARETRQSGHSTMKRETFAHSSFISESPSNESLEGLRFKSSLPALTNIQAENARAVNQSRSNIGSSDVVEVPKSIGRGHRARSGSISFRQIDSSVKTSLSSKGCLPPVDKTRTTVKPKEATKCTPSPLGDSSFILGACENNAEIVKDKIAAILSETRRNRSNKTQPSNDSTKMGSGGRQAHLAPPINPPSISDPHVSWPSNEQEFQTNGRPPLPWRAGIGRALPFHPAPAHDAQRQLEPAAAGGQSRRRSSVEDVQSGHSAVKLLQVGHDEFRLHSQGHNESVRVNLPSSSRPSERLANLSRSESDMSNHPFTRSNFHSHIPVATRTTVNRSVGPESDAVPPAVPLSFVNAEGWQSSAPFPQAPLIQGVSAPHPLDAKSSPVGHRYCTDPPSHPYLQNSARALQSINKPRPQGLDNRSSMPNLSAQMHHSGSRASVPAGSGQQPQYPFSAMQRVKSREFLNNAYSHGQYHERKHVESAQTNYASSTAFATNFYPAADALEWRSQLALRPPEALLFQGRHYVANNPTGMPSGSHGNYVPQQEQQYRNFNTYNNVK